MVLRPWLPLLYRKLTNKDKRRIAAAKAKSEHAMVIKRVNKKGKMTVQLSLITNDTL